ncbi:alanine racemase [Paraburkholderia sp.]|jgi:alanine racemase|uniref:alanine racemase n=1 Tax=Paraburkholderia sp. TaxID=1926495 RepID=UPI002F3E35D4
MPRPILARVSQEALQNNLSVVRAKAPHSKVWAVVKANAYGHGIARAFPALRSADGFALLDLQEAVQVRELGWQGPILLLEGFFEPADLALIDRYGLTTAVHNADQLRMIELADVTRPISLYFKINTGMNRLGFGVERAAHQWEHARQMRNVGSITLMTHFANADGPAGIEEPYAAFRRATAALPGERSCANSAATLWHPQSHLDWVRPGIVLYGGSPSGVTADIAGTGLRGAMSLTSKLIEVQTLKTGDAVGYGSRFVAEQPMRIGVVACGYADGYPRTAPTGTPIAVDGVKTRVVGRVSMDMLTVDLTPCPHAGLGAPVELWGETIPVDDVAHAAGTLGYELMCAVTQRVPVSVE